MRPTTLQSANKPFRPEETVEGPLQFEAILAQMMGRQYTATLVKLDAVRAGGTGPVGFVDATDLIQQLDADNNGIPNVTMHNLPYFRLQGGHNAIVIDPVVGDIGLAIFARKDITAVKRDRVEGKPPSRRQFDPSDGLYIGGLLNGAPTQWLRFLDSGVHIKATSEVTIDATHLQVNCPITSTGDITDHTSSMQAMRDVYNEHQHNGGPPPDQRMT